MDWKLDRIGSAERGENPMVLAKMKSGFAVIGDSQFRMNLGHYLHAYIEARYDWEPEEYKSRPSYFYPKELRYGAQYEYDETKHGEMKQQLTEALLALMGQ